MSDSGLVVFRIAHASTNFKALDLSGLGAARDGGRWSEVRVRMVYASRSRALAVLETLVHHAQPYNAPLPLDRYLIEIAIPRLLWNRRERFDAAACPAWDAIPVGASAREWGTHWARGQRSAVAEAPSVVVPEERNVLFNPAHPDAGSSGRASCAGGFTTRASYRSGGDSIGAAPVDAGLGYRVRCGCAACPCIPQQLLRSIEPEARRAAASGGAPIGRLPWLVGSTGIEPVTPTMSRQNTKPL